MSKKFAEYSKLDLSNVNKEVLKKWQDGDIFHKSLEIREGHPSFVFYEGPPSNLTASFSDTVRSPFSELRLSPGPCLRRQL